MRAATDSAAPRAGPRATTVIQRRTHPPRDPLSIHGVYMTTIDVLPRAERFDAFVDWLRYDAS